MRVGGGGPPVQHTADCRLRCDDMQSSPVEHPQGSVGLYHRPRVSFAMCTAWAPWPRGIWCRGRSEERRNNGATSPRHCVGTAQHGGRNRTGKNPANNNRSTDGNRHAQACV